RQARREITHDDLRHRDGSRCHGPSSSGSDLLRRHPDDAADDEREVHERVVLLAVRHHRRGPRRRYRARGVPRYHHDIDSFGTALQRVPPELLLELPEPRPQAAPAPLLSGCWIAPEPAAGPESGGPSARHGVTLAARSFVVTGRLEGHGL